MYYGQLENRELNNVQLVIFSLYNSIFQEPMSHGYLYACGLFLTTFCSAFINSQFNYWVRKIFFSISVKLSLVMFKIT